jgi:hypothetical protein
MGSVAPPAAHSLLRLPPRFEPTAPPERHGINVSCGSRPRYSLALDDPANIWAIGLLFVVGLIVSGVAFTSHRRATEVALLRRQAIREDLANLRTLTPVARQPCAAQRRSPFVATRPPLLALTIASGSIMTCD